MDKWLDAYYKARKSSRRSRKQVDYEIHFERNLMQLRSNLENKTYRPTTEAFFVSRPKLREVFSCEMSLNVIDTRLLMALTPHIEKELTDRTFNNRVGYGAIKAINTLIEDVYSETEGHTKQAHFIKFDIAGYFPNAIHTIAYDKLSNILEKRYEGEDKDQLRELLKIGIFSSATKRCKRLSAVENWQNYPTSKSLFAKPDGIGGVIGRGLWQVAMNVYLNDLDKKAINDWGLKWCRFVDDVVIVTKNKEVVLSMLPTIRNELSKVGVTMHPKKFYCQPTERGIEYIGAVIKGRRVYAKNKTISNALHAIRLHNKKITKSNRDSFISSINSYLGIMKGRCEYNSIARLISEVSPKWERYCYFDKKRICYKPTKETSKWKMLENKFNFKILCYDQKENRRIGKRKTPPCRCDAW